MQPYLNTQTVIGERASPNTWQHMAQQVALTGANALTIHPHCVVTTWGWLLVGVPVPANARQHTASAEISF